MKYILAITLILLGFFAYKTYSIPKAVCEHAELKVEIAQNTKTDRGHLDHIALGAREGCTVAKEAIY